jgi:outer membrane receptor for ferrienterochelin and colicins
MELSEYFGLPNRSKHMANFKILYEKNNFFINTRLMYRSKWAVSDKDGNGLYNTNDEFASGFIQLNCSIGNQIKQINIQTGCDNILNYSDMNNLPNMPGRTFYISFKYQLTNKQHK